MKVVCNTAGYLIYLDCGHQFQETLKEAEHSGRLSIDSYQNDPSGIILVENILEVIAIDSASWSVKREVDLLTNIYTSTRQEFEPADDFVVKFTSAVTSYANQTLPLNGPTNRQLAILMLRNAKLSPDTMNSIIFWFADNVTPKVKSPWILYLLQRRWLNWLKL